MPIVTQKARAQEVQTKRTTHPLRKAAGKRGRRAKREVMRVQHFARWPLPTLYSSHEWHCTGTLVCRGARSARAPVIRSASNCSTPRRVSLLDASRRVPLKPERLPSGGRETAAVARKTSAAICWECTDRCSPMRGGYF